jgi:hypothetical protein
MRRKPQAEGKQAMTDLEKTTIYRHRDGATQQMFPDAARWYVHQIAIGRCNRHRLRTGTGKFQNIMFLEISFRRQRRAIG